MRRLKLILFGLLLLVLALFLAGYVALRSPAVRGKIERSLSESLGRPVKLGRISVSFLPTPALDAYDITIGGGDSTSAPGFFLRSLHAVPRVSSFLPGRKMTVDRIELRGLTIAFRRDKTGKWHLPVVPAPTPAREEKTETGVSPPIDIGSLIVDEGRIRVVDDSLRNPKGGPTVTTISDIEAELQAVGGAIKTPHLSGKLGTTLVTGSAEAGPRGATLRLGSESIENADLPSLFALATIQPYHDLTIGGKAPFELTTTVAPDFKTFVAKGKASIERVNFGVLTLDRMSSPFRYEKGVFTLDPFTFTFYGGEEQGTVSVDLNREVPSYSIRSSLHGLDVNRALSATTTMKDFLLGTADLSADVRGSGATAPAIQKSLTGSARFKVADGTIRMPIIAAINQALGITEGSGKDTRFQSFSATAAIGGGRARTNDLQLRAGDLTVVGSGTMGFDQTLDFRLKAILSPAKSRELTSKAGFLGDLRNALGQLEIPLTITGTATNPKTRVDIGSVAKKQMKGIEKGLQRLFK